MIKNNKWKMIISSVIILLPAIVGLIFWDNIPKKLPIHWDINGNVNNYSSASFGVLGMPLILLAFHWLFLFFTGKDPKNKNQNKKVFGMIFWCCPIISLFAYGIVFATICGKEFEIRTAILFFLGFIFLLIGNYIPKCKQNHTIGIKIKWTLANEENWNVTHRLCGKIWVIGGFVFMASAFLPAKYFLLVVLITIAIMVFVPAVYSYVYYKKQVKEGTAPEKAVNPVSKGTKVFSSVIIAISLITVAVVLCTGEIEILYNDTCFKIESDYWTDLSVDYNEVDNIEFRENLEVGERVSGFGSPKLSLGTFKNEEFGYYTIYSYTNSEAHVIIEIDDKILVIGGKGIQSTKDIYEELTLRAVR